MFVWLFVIMCVCMFLCVDRRCVVYLLLCVVVYLMCVVCVCAVVMFLLCRVDVVSMFCLMDV